MMELDEDDDIGLFEPPHHPNPDGNDIDMSSSSSSESSALSSSDSDMEGGFPLVRIPSPTLLHSESDGEEDYMAAMRDAEELLITVLQNRVLFPNKVHKESQLYLVLVKFKQDDPKRFRRNLRVSPETFDAIHDDIADHPIFHNQSPSAEQFDVCIQLAIALYRFGHDGNAASVESIAQWAGVSAGTVVNCTRRVIIALLSLHDNVIQYPSQEEKELAKEWVEAASVPGWRDGWCMVDGTLIPLAEKPGYHGETYYDRKSNYSLNVQVRTAFDPTYVYQPLTTLPLLQQLITLPNLRIVDYVIGHCGSAHDSTVFQESRTSIDHDELFADGEWMWADSAYASEDWCITPYKKTTVRTTAKQDI
jgi:hypothetical protein